MRAGPQIDRRALPTVRSRSPLSRCLNLWVRRRFASPPNKVSDPEGLTPSELPMALVLTAGPAVEPVSLADAKAHLRIDGSDEDALLGSLIVTSRLHVESVTGLALITQSWSYFMDTWPRGPAVKLPLRPVQSIAAVRIYDRNAVVTTLDPETYLLDGAAAPARLVRQDGVTWPHPRRVANSIEIAFTAGFGNTAEDVPAPTRQAILLLVAHWYEHRSPFEVGVEPKPAPSIVTDLLAPYRRVRL